MAVRANKPAFNIREKLKELTHNIGLKGRELMSAATTQDARNLVSAGRKNLVHNGDFRVDQRGGPHTTISGYHFDRWKFQKDGLAQYAHSVTQSSDSPDEFNNSLRLEVTTSETGLSTTEDLCLTHHIEGQDCQALMAGTSSAKPFTLSFWVKSTKTGNYSTTSTVEQSGTNKIFSTAYRINQANTWEYKVVKFPPCPGVIADTTSPEISFRWILNAGTAYTTGTNLDQWADYASNLFAGGHETQIMTDGDVWQITGVQVEVGENATDFEYRSYGEELALCQRYCYQITGGSATFPICNGSIWDATTFIGVANLPVPLRDPNNVDLESSAASHVVILSGGATDDATALSQVTHHSGNQVEFHASVTMTVGNGAWARLKSGTTFIRFVSEL